jgi:hypothetical protein
MSARTSPSTRASAATSIGTGTSSSTSIDDSTRTRTSTSTSTSASILARSVLALQLMYHKCCTTLLESHVEDQHTYSTPNWPLEGSSFFGVYPFLAYIISLVIYTEQQPQGTGAQSSPVARARVRPCCFLSNS